MICRVHFQQILLKVTMNLDYINSLFHLHNEHVEYPNPVQSNGCPIYHDLNKSFVCFSVFIIIIFKIFIKIMTLNPNTLIVLSFLKVFSPVLFYKNK